MTSQCAVPWCRTRGEFCDLDHRVPHAHGGPTCACNTQPLCRRHHRLKSAGYLRCEASTDPRHPPGTVVWTTRAGRRVIALPHAPLPADAYSPTVEELSVVPGPVVAQLDPADDPPPF